eukprot:m.107393 g.107393  ORF g.107393 m.107393 type:complete len:61 (-) comp51700_c0_seq15:1422-1604(-)
MEGSRSRDLRLVELTLELFKISLKEIVALDLFALNVFKLALIVKFALNIIQLSLECLLFC